MFGLTIWHALCIAITLLWLITAYRLHVSKHARFDARGLPIVDKIRPMPKVAKPKSIDASKCIFIVGGPGDSGSAGGTGGDSGSC